MLVIALYAMPHMLLAAVVLVAVVAATSPTSALTHKPQVSSMHFKCFLLFEAPSSLTFVCIVQKLQSTSLSSPEPLPVPAAGECSHAPPAVLIQTLPCAF